VSDLLPLGEALSRDHRVLIPDLPGYGETPGGDLSYDVTNLRLVEMLRARNSTVLHGIIGFSGGVLRALYLLLRAEIAATHLVSIAGLAGLADPEREQFREFAAMIRGNPGSVTEPAMIEVMGTRMLSPGWRADHPADIERVGRWLTLLAPADLVAELEAVACTEDFRPHLSRIKTKVHARVGELDQACPVAKSEALVRDVPGARLEIVPGCGHALLIEDAEATTAWAASRLG
jgi:3-oxoadipate enol-lactonase